MPIVETGKDVTARWRWDSGLFNVIIWVRADREAVAATFGGLYEGPGNFSNRPGGIVLLDGATGTLRWRVDTPSQAFPAALDEHLVVAGTADGTVFALDRATGAERWRVAFPGIPFQVIEAGGVLVVADADPETWGPNGLVDKTRLAGRVRGLDRSDGRILWETTVGSFNAFIATDGTAIVASSNSPQTNGETAALDPATGNILWRRPFESSSPPAIGDGLVLLPGSELRALDAATGEQRWAVAPRRGGTFFFPALVGGLALGSTNTGTLELRIPASGSEIAFAEVGECTGQWFEAAGIPQGLLCGSLVRLEQLSGAWRLVRVLTPQGAIDSFAQLGDAIVFSTGIGSAPDGVTALEP